MSPKQRATPKAHGHHIHHVYVHLESDPEVRDLLTSVIANLHTLQRQERHLMSDVQSIKQLVTDLNDETNAVAAKIDAQAAAIQALKDQIAAGGAVTQADLDAISDGLMPISARLKTLGADPAEPIPAAASKSKR